MAVFNLPFMQQPNIGFATDIYNALLDKQLAQEKQRLANKLYPELTQANINQKNFKTLHPSIAAGGAAAQIEAADLEEQNGNLDQASTIRNALNALTNSRNASAGWNQIRTENTRFKRLPSEWQTAYVAKGAQYGWEPQQTIDFINSGGNINHVGGVQGQNALASQSGPSQVPGENNALLSSPPQIQTEPVYPQTKSSISKNQATNARAAEVEHMQSITSKYVEPYSDTFAGISPEMTKDLWKWTPDAQRRYGEYMGAMAVQKEIQSGRIAAAAGQQGITIVQALEKAANAGLPGVSGLRSSKISYQAAQNVINKIIREGNAVRSSTNSDPFAQISQARNGSTSASPTQSKWAHLSLEQLQQIKPAGAQ